MKPLFGLLFLFCFVSCKGKGDDDAINVVNRVIIYPYQDSVLKKAGSILSRHSMLEAQETLVVDRYDSIMHAYFLSRKKDNGLSRWTFLFKENMLVDLNTGSEIR